VCLRKTIRSGSFQDWNRLLIVGIARGISSSSNSIYCSLDHSFEKTPIPFEWTWKSKVLSKRWCLKRYWPWLLTQQFLSEFVFFSSQSKKSTTCRFRLNQVRRKSASKHQTFQRPYLLKGQHKLDRERKPGPTSISHESKVSLGFMKRLLAQAKFDGELENVYPRLSYQGLWVLVINNVTSYFSHRSLRSWNFCFWVRIRTIYHPSRKSDDCGHSFPLKYSELNRTVIFDKNMIWANLLGVQWFLEVGKVTLEKSSSTSAS